MIVTDSYYVFLMLSALLKNNFAFPSDYLKWDHLDFWQAIVSALALSQFKFRVVWTPGHATYRDIEEGRVNDTYAMLNHGADELAKAGADNNLPVRAVVRAAQQRMKFAGTSQTSFVYHIQSHTETLKKPRR